jgi:hypothetical protein
MIIHYNNDTPVDLTDAIIRVQFRRQVSSPTFYAFTVTKEYPLEGMILLTMDKDQTTLLKEGRYVFDGDYEINGQRISFVKGVVNVYARVTR